MISLRPIQPLRTSTPCFTRRTSGIIVLRRLSSARTMIRVTGPVLELRGFSPPRLCSYASKLMTGAFSRAVAEATTRFLRTKR